MFYGTANLRKSNWIKKKKSKINKTKNCSRKILKCENSCKDRTINFNSATISIKNEIKNLIK